MIFLARFLQRLHSLILIYNVPRETFSLYQDLPSCSIRHPMDYGQRVCGIKNLKRKTTKKSKNKRTDRETEIEWAKDVWTELSRMSETKVVFLEKNKKGKRNIEGFWTLAQEIREYEYSRVFMCTRFMENE